MCLFAVIGCRPSQAPVPHRDPTPPTTRREPFRDMKRGLASQSVVLTYHDVITRRDRNSLWFDCTTDEFAAQLDYLTHRHASFISLNQLYRHLTQGAALPPNPVAITFADNYLGFYERALPILRERRIPAAMFVHTGYVGSKVGRPKMSWSQLRQIDREGLVTIGSQTVTHPEDLRTLDDAQVAREMVQSKTDLENRLGHPIPYLAYPNGKFDRRSESAAKAAGYRMAFSEDCMPAERSPTIFAVARYVHTKMREAWQAVPHGFRRRPPADR